MTYTNEKMKWLIVGDYSIIDNHDVVEVCSYYDDECPECLECEDVTKCRVNGYVNLSKLHTRRRDPNTLDIIS